MRPVWLLLIAAGGMFAQTHPLQELIDAARTHSPRLKELIAAGLPGLNGRDGAAVWGQEFLFAVESEDYDPAKTQQTYEMEETEQAKPVFRIKVANRDVW